MRAFHDSLKFLKIAKADHFFGDLQRDSGKYLDEMSMDFSETISRNPEYNRKPQA